MKREKCHLLTVRQEIKMPSGKVIKEHSLIRAVVGSMVVDGIESYLLNIQDIDGSKIEPIKIKVRCEKVFFDN